MRTGNPLEIVVGDVIRLRKPHPCGSFEWTVVRVGADIGLRCHGCSRKVMLPRREVEKRLKTFVSRGPAYILAEAILAEQAAIASQASASEAPSE